MAQREAEQSQVSTSPISRPANFFRDLDAIVGFFPKVLVPVLGGLFFLQDWIEERILRMPTELLGLGFWTSVIVGVSLLLGCFLFAKGRWTRGLAALGAVLSIVGAGEIYLFKPPEPEWQRINAFEVLREESLDLPIMLVRDELTGRNGLFPGGEPYRRQILARAGGEALQEPWAGYYSSLLVSSTLPTRVALRQGDTIGPDSASIGVYAFKWNEDAHEVQVALPESVGYTSLQSEVSLGITLEGDERAAMIVFVYPRTAAASSNLPDSLEEIVGFE